MSEQDIFIGREKELQMIDEMVFDPTGKNHFIWMVGEGGVGKTWLLKQVYEKYQSDSRIAIITIDYSEIRTQSVSSLSQYLLYEALSEYLTQEKRESYKQRVEDLQAVAKVESDMVKIQQQEEALYWYGVQLVEEICQEKRLLILCDTAEAITTTEFGTRVNRFAAVLSNVVLVIAGRPYPRMQIEVEEYKKIFESWEFHPVYPLEPFSSIEVIQYFDKALPSKITRTLQEKINLLTNGNPVLISIAGEWLTRHIDLPSDIDLSLSELQAMDTATLKKHQERFEFELIEKIRQLRQPIDWAVLYLAYLNRRYDPQILELTLGSTNATELDEIVQELQTLVFVRKSMLGAGGLLHDEAQRLINEHAWPVVDPDGAMRRELAEKVIAGYYLPKIERLRAEAKASIDRALALSTPDNPIVPPIPDEEFLRYILQIECWDYQMRISKERGLAYLSQLVDEALKARSYIQMDAITQAIYNLAPGQRNQPAFQVRVAEILWRQKQADRAVSLAQTALASADIAPADAAHALNILGQAAEASQEKITHFEAALEKAREAGDIIRQATFLQNLGLLYRRFGQWAQAEEKYRQGLSLLGKETDSDLYANLLNNLAYVMMLRGQLERADNLAERALQMRKDLGNRPGLAFSYFTKGRIADAQGNYAGALRHYKAAQEWFRSIPDVDNAVWVQVDMAQLERRAERFAAAYELLAPALESPRPDVRAEALSQAAKVAIDEAEALMRRGATSETWQAVYAQAREYARQAHAAAEALGDAHLQAVEWFDLALVTLLAEGRADAEAIPALEALLAVHDFPLEQAHLAEHYGALDELAGETEAAFDHYLAACRILAAYSIGRFRRVFERVRARFLNLPPDIQAQVCAGWRPELGGIPSTSPLKALQALCQDDLAEW